MKFPRHESVGQPNSILGASPIFVPTSSRNLESGFKGRLVATTDASQLGKDNPDYFPQDHHGTPGRVRFFLVERISNLYLPSSGRGYESFFLAKILRDS